MSETPFCDRVASALALGPGNTFQDRDSWEKTARAMERELEEAKRSLSDRRWIPVAERLPNPNAAEEYIVASSTGYRTTLEFDADGWKGLDGRENDGYWNDFVTHWMPLPEGPK